jgi:hypothetical protein
MLIMGWLDCWKYKRNYMKNPFERNIGSLVEREEDLPEVQIKLHIMRHDIRASTGEATQEEREQGIDPDNRTPLTPEGMKNAAERGRDDVDLSRARVIGSARERSRHTAGFHMVGGREEVGGTESLDDLEKVVQELGENKAHFRVDERLNFHDDKSAPLGGFLNDAYENKTYLKTIVNESDDFARKQGGEYQSTYTGKAAQMADLVNAYLKAAPRLVNLVPGIQKSQVEKHGEDRRQSQSAFERFMGTHQGMAESFLLKVVEIAQGVEARNELLSEIGNAGFGYSEGIDINLVQKGPDTKAELVYINPRTQKETRLELSRDILEKILQEAEGMKVGR